MNSLDYLIGNSTIIKACSWMLALFLLLNIDSKNGTGYFLLFIVMVVYCVFYSPTTGDNYTSMESYYAYRAGIGYEQLHFERVYFYIMDIVPYGYVYYRLVLWGSACLLCVWLMKKMEISGQVATLSVLTFALPILLYYQRAAFAYVLLYFALYCFVTKGGGFEAVPFLKRHYIFVSAGILLCTIPFHTTMPVYVLFLLIALFVPKSETGLLFLILGLMVFSTSLISNSISMLKFFQEDTIETGLRSLENDTGIVGQNFNGALAYFLHWLPLYCMLLYGLFFMVKSPCHHTYFEKVCLVNTFILIVLSIMFMPYSYIIQIKFRNAAMMPWTLYLASYYTRNSGTRACSLYALATIPTFFI